MKKLLAEKKHSSLNILETILNSMDALLYVSDIQTDEVLFVNDRIKEHFNLGGEAVGSICWKVFHAGLEKRCDFCPLRRLPEDSDWPIVWEARNTITGRFYRNASRIVEWPDGKMVHLLHSTDITDIRLAEEKLIKAKEETEHSSQAKGEFLSRMSHEMRTPMNAIIGMADIARKSGDLQKTGYCLDKIDTASKHLLGLINDVLDMSKIEAHKLELSPAEFDIEKMLLNITGVANFRVEEKKQSLVINIDKDIPPVFIGDEMRLGQVIANLLSNAIKFTPDGGTITVNVRIDEVLDETWVLLFEVIDNGIGISKEQQAKLFMPFEQADGSVARKYGGTGLGLTISKGIVELLGGRIWLESEVGRGTKLSFTAKMNIAKGLPRAETPVYNFTGHTLLIAEDIEINREIISAVLEGTKISMEFAHSGIQVLSMFKNDPDKYSLILMDIQMPEMDGYEASQRIRSSGGTRAENIPIIAMTANIFREDVERCIDAGMSDHVGKPIDTSELFKKLDKYLNPFGR